MAYQTITVLPSAARTTTGNSGAVTSDTGDTLALQVDVTAVSGTTPTLLVSIQWSMDGTAWAVLDPAADAFTSITTTTSVVKNFPSRAPFYRLLYTIGGTTPSFTFSVRSYETT